MINSKEGREEGIFFKMQNPEKVWIASSTNLMNINIHIVIYKAILDEWSRLSSEQDTRLLYLIKFLLAGLLISLH